MLLRRRVARLCGHQNYTLGYRQTGRFSYRWRWEERLRRDGVPTEEALAWRDSAFEHAEGPMAAPGSPRIRRHAAAAAELRPTAAALAWRAAAFQHAEQPMAVPRPDDDERGAGPPQVGARAGRGPKGPPV